MGLYQVVYAAESSKELKSSSGFPLKIRGTEGRYDSHQGEGARDLESLVKRIRKRSEEAESKIQQVGIESERVAFQKEKSELEQADINIREQFKQTEARIKNLPPVIQQRQKAFEQRYEKNFAQLKAELDSINSAKTSSEFTARTSKLKAFLDKIKPPQRHIKLNPNKLPHRMMKPVWRTPRMHYSRPHPTLPLRGEGTPESPLLGEDEGEVQSLLAPWERTEGEVQSLLAPWERTEGEGYSPIQIASLTTDNLGFSFPPLTKGQQGGFDFVPSPLLGEGQGEGYSPVQLASLTTDRLLSSAIVQTIPPPTATDLTSTEEVQFTPAILAKAAELNHNPVQIYNWVYDNIEYVPTYGSIQGADLCLQTMQCNDIDTASLLIALLRASNIPARYVYGTIQLPIAQVMNWVGGFTDPKSAVNLLASGGIPSKTYVAGGQISYVQLEHVWVEAYVPYGNYRGMMSDQSIKTWIPLDGSFKQYQYKQGMDLYSALNINGASFINAYITDTTGLGLSPDAQAAINSIIPDFMMSPYQFYSQRLFNYLDATNPTATIDDIIGADTIPDTKVIIQKNFSYLVGGLYYKVISKGGEYAALPNNLLYQLSFVITDESGTTTELSYNTTLPEIAGKRLTLSYQPATPADQALVAQYGSMFSVPAYLLNVKPVIELGGITVATGAGVGIAQTQQLSVTFASVTRGTDIETSNITSGEYDAIVIMPYKVVTDVVGNQMRVLYGNIGSADLDSLLGQMLYSIGVSYFGHLNFEEQLYEANLRIVNIKQPSYALVSADVIPTYIFGTVSKVDEGGVSIDVKRDIDTPLPINGDMGRTQAFMNISGLGGSSWESSILGGFFSVPTVSAVKLLNSAYKQGIPIYTINSSNMNTILPQLQVDPSVISAIQDAINAGYEVIISQSNVQYYDWNGVGYIVYDPSTGAGGYMISGGLMGAGTTKPIPAQELDALYARLCMNKRSLVLGIALMYIMTPYRQGGKLPGGFDCSGFVGWVYLLAGYPQLYNGTYGISAAAQYMLTKHTDYPLIADLIFYSHTINPGYIHHVGIIIFQGLMIDAPNSNSYVRIEPFWTNNEYQFFGYLVESCN